MKTLEDVRIIFHGTADAVDPWQAIADAWNADVEDLGRQVGYYLSTAQSQMAQTASLRKQLRKARNELKDLSAAHDQACAVGFRLENLIERIARCTK